MLNWKLFVSFESHSNITTKIWLLEESLGVIYWRTKHMIRFNCDLQLIAVDIRNDRWMNVFESESRHKTKAERRSRQSTGEKWTHMSGSHRQSLDANPRLNVNYIISKCLRKHIYLYSMLYLNRDNMFVSTFGVIVNTTSASNSCADSMETLVCKFTSRLEALKALKALESNPK